MAIITRKCKTRVVIVKMLLSSLRLMTYNLSLIWIRFKTKKDVFYHVVGEFIFFFFSEFKFFIFIFYNKFVFLLFMEGSVLITPMS